MSIKDIEIKQGKTFEWLILALDVNGAPLNMAGFTGGTAGSRGMIRKRYSDTTPVATFDMVVLNKSGVLDAVASGACHLTTAQIAALEENSAGVCYILVTLAAAATAVIPQGEYVYDIETEDTTGFVDENYRGQVVVLPEATWATP